MQATQIPIDDCMNKMWYVYAMKYDAVFKRRDMLSHASTWMNFEDIINEIKQL